jgi:hypothetical protein
MLDALTTDELGSAAFDSLADVTSAGEDERPVLGAVCSMM